ncbi:MAG: hypothetical protein V8T87_00135 [Victivallales bacterium]
MTKEELKRQVCAAIDAQREKIMEIGNGHCDIPRRHSVNGGPPQWSKSFFSL